MRNIEMKYKILQKVMDSETKLNKCPVCDCLCFTKENIFRKEGSKQKMASIRDSAKAFVPKQTKNIADLETVNLDWPVEDRIGNDKDNKPFEYKVVVKDGEDYRIPGSVLNAIKTIIEAKPKDSKSS